MLAQSPERDRDIEGLQTLIKNCAAAGIGSIKYNMSILGVVRLPGRAPGRGDSTLSAWRLADAHPATPLTRAGRVDAAAFWERITYFLDRIIPVANEYKIRMACHPHDPGMPPEGYQGVDRVLGTVDGLKRFITIRESPYHGLNFCQGTVSEMLQNPGRRSSTSFDTLASARRSSTCTSAISAYIATSLWRCSRMKAMSISSRPFRCTKKFAILTC
jgi:mannonate dehydratase